MRRHRRDAGVAGLSVANLNDTPSAGPLKYQDFDIEPWHLPHYDAAMGRNAAKPRGWGIDSPTPIFREKEPVPEMSLLGASLAFGGGAILLCGFGWLVKQIMAVVL